MANKSAEMILFQLPEIQTKKGVFYCPYEPKKAQKRIKHIIFPPLSILIQFQIIFPEIPNEGYEKP